MYKFRVKKITGFYSLRPITIYEKRKDRFEIFYQRDAHGFNFNLPSGIYYTDGYPTKLSKPVLYSLPPLPKPDVEAVLPKKLKLIQRNNPNKCSVYPSQGKVVMDPSIGKYPLPSIVHVLFHEIGHYYYNNTDDPNMESNCDAFASYHMLKMGYNPSQCLSALKRNLTGAVAVKRNSDHWNYLRYVTNG